MDDTQPDELKRTVMLSTTFEHFLPDARELHFIKHSDQPITAANISQVRQGACGGRSERVPGIGRAF